MYITYLFGYAQCTQCQARIDHLDWTACYLFPINSIFVQRFFTFGLKLRELNFLVTRSCNSNSNCDDKCKVNMSMPWKICSFVASDIIDINATKVYPHLSPRSGRVAYVAKHLSAFQVSSCLRPSAKIYKSWRLMHVIDSVYVCAQIGCPIDYVLCTCIF